MRRWRILLAALMAIGLAITVAVVILHTSVVQRRVFSVVKAKLKEHTCLDLQADRFSYRLWPTQFSAEGIRLEGSNGAVVTAESITAEWRWTQIMATPRKLKRLDLGGLELDLSSLPEACVQTETDESPDLLQTLDIDLFTLRDARLTGSADTLSASAGGFSLDSSLQNGHFRLEAQALHLQAQREDRLLDLGMMSMTLDGSSSEVGLRDLQITEGALQLEVEGRFRQTAETLASASFSAEMDADEVLSWLQPSEATGINVEGRLNLSGKISWSPERGFNIEASHTGTMLRLAGYDLSRINVRADPSHVEASLSDPSWGSATVNLNHSEQVGLRIELHDADPLPALLLTPVDIPFDIPKALRISGRADGVLSLPMDLESLSLQTDIEARWPEGVVNIRASAADSQIEIERFLADAYGTNITGNATFRPGGTLHGEVKFKISNPAATTHRLGAQSALPTLGGGEITGRATLGGSIQVPTINGLLSWDRPEVADAHLLRAEAKASGDTHLLKWSVEVMAPGESTATVEGTAALSERKIEGFFEIEAPDLGAAGTAWKKGNPLSTSGNLRATGSFSTDEQSWRLRTSAEGHGLEIDRVSVPILTFEAEADPQCLNVKHFAAEILDGTISGRTRISTHAEKPEVDF
ncbi:MAG: hypothetical protein K8R59_08300, partial [Thermoanaerobaculales bacterium]|nr:hypothetical protein [Thermoanaerobaculales bacterium]